MSDWKIIVPTATTNYVRNPSAEVVEVVGSELIVNGGFETAGAGGADVFGSWIENVGDGAIARTTTAGEFYAGAAAAKLTAGATVNTNVYQNVVVTAGRMYRLVFYVRGDGTNAGRLQIYDVSNSVVIRVTESTGVTAATYAYRSVSFVAPAGCTKVRVYLMCPSANGGVAYFDDVSLLEANAGAVHISAGTGEARSTAYAAVGAYAYAITTAADNQGAIVALSTLPNAACYVTMRVAGTLPTAWDWSLDNSNYTEPTLLMALDATWSLYGCAFVAAQANASTALYVRQKGAGSGTFYLDAIQVEQGTTWTTYCDGDQPGCEWLGSEHASASSRSAVTRDGGTLYDFEDDFALIVEGYIGLGMAPRATTQDGYAGLPGGALNNSIRTARTFTITGFINSSSYADLLDKRRALIDALNPERYPRTDTGWQPVTLWHCGGTTYKRIRAYYEAGLEIDHNWQLPVNERVALRFYAPDPNWYEIGQSSTALDTNDTATLRYLAGRLKSTGQWDDLGLTANPTAGGAVYTICVASDKSVYFGGAFKGLNNGNPAGMDYAARYIPSTDSWQVLVGASDLNNVVWAIAEGPDKKIYLAGEFTEVDGDAGGDADHVIVYNPTTNAWEKLGVPNTGTANISAVHDMAWDSSGNLYVVGLFENFANVANADGVAQWSGAAWAAVGAPTLTVAGVDRVWTIAIDADDNIFVGGEWLGWLSDANWAWWNGTAWDEVDDIVLNAAVYHMRFDPAGTLYVAGNFTNADSVANADYIFAWTGTEVQALDTGVSNQVRRVALAPDGKLWAAGGFTTAGSLSSVERMAVWNGSTWLPPDVNLSGVPTTYGIAFGTQDASVPDIYSIYIGGTTSGAATFAGDATVTNSGTVPAYPQIVIGRSGGTSARIVSVRNATTGKELSFDYALLSGETLTIDTHPDRQTCESSFYGPRPDAILAGSDLSDFMLLPGANTITAFVDTAGSPTITAYMLWSDSYDGIDD